MSLFSCWQNGFRCDFCPSPGARAVLLRFSDESSRPLLRIWRLALSRGIAARMGRPNRTILTIPRTATSSQPGIVAGTCADYHGMPASFRMDGGSLPGGFLCVVDSEGSGSTRFVLAAGTYFRGRDSACVAAGRFRFGVPPTAGTAHKWADEGSSHRDRRFYLFWYRWAHASLANSLAAANRGSSSEPVPCRRWRS
jgi:hypothetical protein